jgi:hypothetical protein
MLGLTIFWFNSLSVKPYTVLALFQVLVGLSICVADCVAKCVAECVSLHISPNSPCKGSSFYMVKHTAWHIYLTHVFLGKTSLLQSGVPPRNFCTAHQLVRIVLASTHATKHAIFVQFTALFISASQEKSSKSFCFEMLQRKRKTPLVV